jgi:hypothetical protein
MHGNVGEWCLDQLSKQGYQPLEGKSLSALELFVTPTKLYPRVIRGGGWDEDADHLRSAARRGSDDDDWRGEDPNFPQSPWWFTSEPALSVGFRPIRPLHEPAKEDRNKFWEADIEQIRADVENRIEQEGRGSRGVARKELIDAIKKLPQ